MATVNIVNEIEGASTVVEGQVYKYDGDYYVIVTRYVPYENHTYWGLLNLNSFMIHNFYESSHLLSIYLTTHKLPYVGMINKINIEVK